MLSQIFQNLKKGPYPLNKITKELKLNINVSNYKNIKVNGIKT